jgi:hypothetical protein
MKASFPSKNLEIVNRFLREIGFEGRDWTQPTYRTFHNELFTTSVNLGVNWWSWWVTFRVSRKNTPWSRLVGAEKMCAALNSTYCVWLLLPGEKWERSNKCWSLAFFEVTCSVWMVSSELLGFLGVPLTQTLVYVIQLELHTHLRDFVQSGLFQLNFHCSTLRADRCIVVNL